MFGRPNKAQTLLNNLARFWRANFVAKSSETISEPDEVFLTFLRERKIDPFKASLVSMGYSGPEGISQILKTLSEEEISLLKETRIITEEGKERFRNRIMFPIYNVQGNCQGFVGRRLLDQGPKWLDQPQSDYYSKFDHVFNLEVAVKFARQRGLNFVILVEGPIDCYRLASSGISNCISSLGTKITETQAGLIARYFGRVYVATDGDLAGREAAAFTKKRFQDTSAKISVLEMPEEEDPDSLIRDQGIPAFMTLLKKAKEEAQW